MLFGRSELTPSIRIGSSVRVSTLGIRGESLPLGFSAAPMSPVRREEPTERMEAGQQPTRDVRRLIEASGKPLHEIEDYLDWLENTCPSHRI